MGQPSHFRPWKPAGEDIKDLADLRKLNAKSAVGKGNKQPNLDCGIFKSLDSSNTKLV